MDVSDKGQFEDDLLGAALVARAKVEPRAGFEERILSSIEARRVLPRASVPRWAWAFAAGAAGVALVAVILFHHPKVSGPSSPPAAQPEIAKTAKPLISHPLPVRIPPPAANSKTVRLAVFPAPRPLSPEEKMLLAYVNKGHLSEADQMASPSLDEDLKVPKLEVAALDIKPIESSEESPEK